MSLFDPRALRLHARRASALGGDGFFLWEKLASDMRDRLRDIRRDLPHVMEMGPVPPVFDDALRHGKNVTHHARLSPWDSGGDGILPFEPYSLDGLVSAGHMHWIDDLPLFLLQCRHALRPDGVFIAAMAGGETLRELRDSLQQVELRLYGGLSPRVSPFATLPDMAQLMQSAGFALPVADQDAVTLTYPDLKTLVRDLRLAGQTNAVRNRSSRILGRHFWHEVEEHYRRHHSDGGRLVARVEIIHLIGWAPHQSQQQPKQRGSATHRLADLLQTDETGTGEFV